MARGRGAAWRIGLVSLAPIAAFIVFLIAAGDNAAPRACPQGMAFVPGGKTVVLYAGLRWGGVHREMVALDDFCIDKYEASAPDATADSRGTISGDRLFAATSREGALPWVLVTHSDAERACAAAGKRLPTLAEWQTAYSGHDGARWPWGSDAYDTSNTCRVGVEFQAYPTGACCYTNCRGDMCWEVCDMAGNVSEWVATDWNPDCAEQADHMIVAGGYTNSADSPNAQAEDPPGSGCWKATGWGQARYSMHGHSASRIGYDDDGFRCAATPGRDR
ncbi:SUMF1/EgtB/PvdO family nonheme iron enzyme [bacterium]|nr:SUMF1/EgtB/PvdO family nonheme iron enzyme [bacterium]